MRMRPLMSLAALCACTSLAFSCGSSSSGGSGGPSSSFPPAPTGPPSAAEEELNKLLQGQYPGGSPAGSGQEDDSIELASPAKTDPLERTRADPGQSLQIAVGYTSTAPITDICIGFGSPQSAWCIPKSSAKASGTDTKGALGVSLSIDAALCAKLGKICHDIRCYEFAKTSAGTFSKSNINLLAAACGSCSEPSCKALLKDCVPPDTGACNANCFASCQSLCKMESVCNGLDDPGCAQACAQTASQPGVKPPTDACSLASKSFFDCAAGTYDASVGACDVNAACGSLEASMNAACK